MCTAMYIYTMCAYVYIYIYIYVHTHKQYRQNCCSRAETRKNHNNGSKHRRK